MKRSIVITLMLLASVATVALANMNPTGVPESLLQRAGAKIWITAAGETRLEPRTGSGVVDTGSFVSKTINFCADAGSTDAYACSLTPAITAYSTGQVIWFKANTANTGAATLNLNALGAKTIKKASGGITTDLGNNDIRAGQYVGVIYDGTNFEMLSLLGNATTDPTSIIASSISDSDTTHAPDANSVFDALALKQNTLTNPVVAAGSGYKIATGVATITGSGTVVTGLTTVVSITATMQEDFSLTNGIGCSGTIGDQSGAPAAGSVILKCWKPTASGDVTPIASGAELHVNWTARGT